MRCRLVRRTQANSLSFPPWKPWPEWASHSTAFQASLRGRMTGHSALAGWPRRCFERLGDAGTRGTLWLHRISPPTESESPRFGPQDTNGPKSTATPPMPHVALQPRHPKRCLGHPVTVSVSLNRQTTDLSGTGHWRVAWSSSSGRLSSSRNTWQAELSSSWSYKNLQAAIQSDRWLSRRTRKIAQ